MDSSQEMLRPGDLAPRLGVSRARVYQLIAQGLIPALRRGRAIWIPRLAWESWLAREAEQALRGLPSAAECSECE